METPTNQTTSRPRITIPEAPRMAILEAPAMEQQNQPQSTNPPATPSASRTRFFVYPETDINEGHNDKLCQNEALNTEDSAPLGPWIRSNQYGRRVMEEKDKKYHSNPSQSKNFGLYCPTIPARECGTEPSDILARSKIIQMQTTPLHQQV
ncbi:hypothetical protein TSUD_249630 [Trifolium subterraneum]|nr:hypothetical protein TSUD_249630 [Trifolium subterraneum]